MGPSYKTAAPRQSRVQSDDQARRIQFDPKLTEKKGKENWIKGAIKHPGRCTPITKPGYTGHAKALAMRFKKGDIHKDNMKEGHKVQARSYKTVNDMTNKPDMAEDPENPMS